MGDIPSPHPRRATPDPRIFRLRLLCAAALPLACVLLALGCESEFANGPTSHPGDAVLKDPMGYKMNWDNK